MSEDERKEALFVLGMLMTHEKSEFCWCSEEDREELHGNVCNNVALYYNSLKPVVRIPDRPVGRRLAAVAIVYKCNCCGLTDGPYIPIRRYTHDLLASENLCAYCMLIAHSPDLWIGTVKSYYRMFSPLNKEGFFAYGRS